ncbi:hypothetical protein LCGC14_1176310 [marine sediment metagenome]|uniref:Uncharacterized protein n=1 Tax=marine sediment metagenome TaxID=412755 RepID=A0A0F9P6F6_9ZZZZ
MRKLMLTSLAVLLIPIALIVAVLASPRDSGSAQTPLQDEASWACSWSIEPFTDVLDVDGRPFFSVATFDTCTLTLLGTPASDVAVIDTFMGRFLFDLDVTLTPP